MKRIPYPDRSVPAASQARAESSRYEQLLASLLGPGARGLELPSVTDLALSLIALAEGKRRKAILPLSSSTGEFALVRRGSDVLLSYYDSGPVPQIFVRDRALDLAALMALCSEAACELSEHTESDRTALVIAERARRAQLAPDRQLPPASLVRRGESELTMYDAQISGDLFDMPAGAVKMAAGVEYRDESISDIPDDQFQRGLIFGTESVSAAADRENWSAFVEFSVPVLDSLELSLAARYDDYDDFGNTTNPKLAVRWAPIDSLALRASWGTGFRAPSLAQIGLGPSQESQFFTDIYGCADNPDYCTNTDYTINFSGNPYAGGGKAYLLAPCAELSVGAGVMTAPPASHGSRTKPDVIADAKANGEKWTKQAMGILMQALNGTCP